VSEQQGNNHRYEAPRKPPGLISRIFGLFVGLFFFVFISTLTSIAIEWVGMVFFWEDEMSQHSHGVLQQELIYANDMIAQHIFKDFIATLYSGVSVAFRELFAFFGSSFSPSVNGDFATVLNSVGEYGRAAYYVTQIVFLRLIMVITCTFVYLFILSQAVVDGAVSRELRRLGGGRELDKRYLIARRSLVATFFLGNIFYITWPEPVHPLIFILPVVFLMYLALKTTIYRFQKYF
jgi:integrating conjugative element membrane protein (TIGR03747 family)